MVYYTYMQTVDIFTALAEPTRRDIVEMLACHGELSASDISRKFRVSAAAVSQHLKVLRDSELVRVEKQAQRRIYSINPQKLDVLEEWAERMKQLWSERYDRLDMVLEQLKIQEKTK